MGYYGLTPYAKIVEAEAPYARNAYRNKLARDLERNRFGAEQALANKTLAQRAAQGDATLTESKRQFGETMTESQRQFAEQQALQAQAAQEAEARGNMATGIATTGLGIEAYPYLKEGGMGIYNSLIAAEPATASTASLPSGAAAVNSTGALSTTTGASGGAAAGGGASGGSAASSGGLGAGGIAAIIAAAAAGQMAASNSADPVEGQKPGHFFSFNDEGNWRPWLSEPDKNYFSQQLGGGPTTGAKFDAALQRGDMGRAAARLPGFAHDYAIPGLSVAGNVIGDYARRQLGDKTGDRVHTIVDPIGNITRKVGDAKDIGDVGKVLSDTMGTISDPGGGFVGDLANKAVTNWTGNEQLGKAADWITNPIGNAWNTISDWF
jgi:hypothetical protein